MAFAVWVFQPLIWALNGFGNKLLYILGLQAAGEHHGVHSVNELQILVQQSHEAGVLDDLQRQMLQRSFRFKKLTAIDVMIPRPDVAAFDIKTPTDFLLDKAAQISHRRVPVYEGNIDNIIGVLHMHDLFSYARKSQDLDLRKIMRPPLIVPEAIHLGRLLEQFREHHVQIAVVVDEQGGTSGIVTLEDVIEELFGEMQDELATGHPSIQFFQDGRVLVRGNVHLHEVEERVGWLLPNKADTIAGYVMGCLGRTACVGDTVHTAYGQIRVENMQRLRITEVVLIPEAKQ
jgi:CBS domain containing-hemolysin-like protein